jgi:hypothetical protein
LAFYLLRRPPERPPYLALQTLTQEGTLFAVGRKARAFEEIGYYRAQGDNAASPNPPAGALLTYYRREDLAGAGGQNGPRIVLTITDSSGKTVRQMDASNKAGIHRTPWDLRETAPQNPPGGRATVPGAQARGGQRSAVDGEQETEPPPQGGRGGGRGGFGGRGGVRSGPLVRPGTYQVVLGKLVNGVLTPLGKPQTLEVVPLEASNR